MSIVVKLTFAPNQITHGGNNKKNITAIFTPNQIISNNDIIGVSSKVKHIFQLNWIFLYQHLSWVFDSRTWWGVLNAELYDKVCQWLAAGRWVSQQVIRFPNQLKPRAEIVSIHWKSVVWKPCINCFHSLKIRRRKRREEIVYITRSQTSENPVHKVFPFLEIRRLKTTCRNCFHSFHFLFII